MAANAEKVEELYYEALQKAGPERASYLDTACGGNSSLRSRLESLLKANDEAGDFLEAPAFDVDVTMDPGPMVEGPGSMIGPYKLLEKIGEGGMAVVYMAEQQSPVRRRVALKIIKLGMDTVKDMVAEGDTVSERWTGTGTHLGVLMGIPASGKQVTWSGVTIYRFADGKIVETWWAWDTMGLMRQLTQP